MSKQCPECGEFFRDQARVCPYHGVELEERDQGDSFVGTVFDGRFRLERLLGTGGMGRVYEAIQLSVDRRVAVKLIREADAGESRVRDRFEREARVVSELDHPNIVRLLEFGRDDTHGAPYIAMEFIDGVEVRDLLDETRLHPNLALEIADQMAAALVEAHGAQIVHRDLKTDNVLLVPVSSGGIQAKVIDFGVAFPRTSSKRLTDTGMICGTPQYVSPEQARGTDVDPRSDLYSLGVVLFEMIAGALPFEGDSAFNVMMKHVQETPPSLERTLPSDLLPDRLSPLVDDLLAKDPDDRPADAEAVRDRIRDVRDANGWETPDIEADEDLRDTLEEWLLPLPTPEEAPSGGREVYDIVETGDSIQFSAPDFASTAEEAATDRPVDAATTEPAASTRAGPGSATDRSVVGTDDLASTTSNSDVEAPTDDGGTSPDVVGVTGRTGAPRGDAPDALPDEPDVEASGAARDSTTPSSGNNSSAPTRTGWWISGIALGVAAALLGWVLVDSNGGAPPAAPPPDAAVDGGVAADIPTDNAAGARPTGADDASSDAVDADGGDAGDTRARETVGDQSSNGGEGGPTAPETRNGRRHDPSGRSGEARTPDEKPEQVESLGHE